MRVVFVARADAGGFADEVRKRWPELVHSMKFEGLFVMEVSPEKEDEESVAEAVRHWGGEIVEGNGSEALGTM